MESIFRGFLTCQFTVVQVGFMFQILHFNGKCSTWLGGLSQKIIESIYLPWDCQISIDQK